MKKLYFIAFIIMATTHANAEVIGFGDLTVPSNNDITQCMKGEFSGTIECQNVGLMSSINTYRIEATNLPEEITEFTIEVEGGFGPNGAWVKKTNGLFTCNDFNKGTFYINYSGRVSKNGTYTPWIKIENVNGSSSNYEEYHIAINVSAEACIYTGTGSSSQLIISSVNDEYVRFGEGIDLVPGGSYAIEAYLTSGTADDAFEWNIALNHKNGTYTIASGEIEGLTSSTYNFIVPSTLPDYDWARDDNGNIVGNAYVKIDDQYWPVDDGRRISLSYKPNKGKLNSHYSSGSDIYLVYSAPGATSYNLRYKKTTSSSWSTINNFGGDKLLWSFEPGEYDFQIQGVNNRGTGSWSENYILYSAYTQPFEVISNNISAPNNWDVQGSDGADKTFLFYIPTTTTVTVSTNFPESNFDTKIEVFDASGNTTGLYNDNYSGYNYFNGLLSEDSKILNSGYYYLVVDGNANDQGTFKVSLTIGGTSSYTVPFSVIGNTIEENNNWDVNGSDGADKAYRFNLNSDANLKVTTCFQETDYDTKVEIFNLDGTRTGYYVDDGGCNYLRQASTMDNVELTEGSYYLVIDGYAGQEGNFKVDVSINSLKSAAQSDANEYTVLSNVADLGKYDIMDISGESWNVQVYPNPSQEFLNINVSQEGNIRYELIDITGRVVLNAENSQNQIKINTSNIMNGLYLLNIHQGQHTHSEKILIKH